VWWAAAIGSHAEIIGKTDCNNRLCKWRTSILRAVLNWRGQRVDKQWFIARLDVMSSMTEALIFKVIIIIIIVIAILSTNVLESL
jgi:hypothetical protein